MAVFGKQRLGIDLGTANTVICIAGKGIVLRQPTLVAINKESGAIEAYGKEAYRLQGRTSDSYEMIHPIQRGVIANMSVTKQLLAHFINQAINLSLSKPEIVISAPSNISKVERKAVIDAIRSLGVNRAMIVEEPFAAAIGAGMAIEEPRGKMVVDIGGGTTDIATLSYGEIVKSLTVESAGSAMNEAIKDAVRQDYHLIIGDYTAETLKIVMGNANYQEPEDQDHLIVSGQKMGAGVPARAKISAAMVAQAVNHGMVPIINGIKQVFEQTPPELAADIMETGIVLTGGSALLKRLPERIQAEIGVPTRLANLPLDSVALGTGRLFDELTRQSAVIEQKLRL